GEAGRQILLLNCHSGDASACEEPCCINHALKSRFLPAVGMAGFFDTAALPLNQCLVLSCFLARIGKIHSLAQEWMQSLRWKMGASSAAKATAQKANATAKSFLILPLLATRKSLLILPTRDRL